MLPFTLPVLLISASSSATIHPMANWVAITWENDRLLLLSASTSGKTATFEHAAVLDEPKKLGELVSQYRLAKAETVVILNRSDVEVRSMVFPPVPVDELPDLVKFQAAKEFNNYDPSAPVDFFVTNKLEDVSRSTLFPAVKASDAAAMPDGAPKHLLASTLRLATFQKIKLFCEEHNLVLRHIVLRPCATASLWRYSGTAVPDRATLLVELDKNEASQTVVLQGEPMFMRSPKISRPQDVSIPDFAARILAELKRTRIAVRNEVQGIDVGDVVLCGSGGMFESLAEQLTKGLGMPVRLFDPQHGLKIKTQDASELYAAHFGVIQQIVRKEPLHIDFCNPKKREEDTSTRNILTGIIAAGVLLIAGLFGYTYYAQTVLTREVKQLSWDHNELQKNSGALADQKQQLDALERWHADSVNWFEQLAWLSESALPGQDMMVSGLNFTANVAPASPTIGFTALLRDQSLLSPMVERFRDSVHTPTLGQTGPDAGGSRLYQHRGVMTIRLSREAEPPPTEP